MSQGFHPGREPSDLKKVKTVEENGEEAEPVRNGAESISEGEGVDANSGSTDSSGERVTFPFKPGKWIPAFLCVSYLFTFTLLSPYRNVGSLWRNIGWKEEAHHRVIFTKLTSRLAGIS